MPYTVVGYKKVVDHWEDEAKYIKDFKQSKSAVRDAFEIYQEGKYDRIEIHHTGAPLDGVERYYNAREGISLEAQDWIEEFEAGYEPE